MVCVTVLVGSSNGTGGGRVESHAAMPASRFGRERGGSNIEVFKQKEEGWRRNELWIMDYGALMTDGLMDHLRLHKVR